MIASSVLDDETKERRDAFQEGCVIAMAASILDYPQLGEVLMVEEAIRGDMGSHNRKQMWKVLPEKIAYKKFCLIVDYLLCTNKIAADRNGTLVWVWNPKMVAKYRKRKDLILK